MIDEKLQSLVNKYVDLEVKLAEDVTGHQTTLSKISDPLEKQEFLLENILPLKILALLQMEKANVVTSILFQKFDDLEKELFVKMQPDLWDLEFTANEAVKNEWNQIKELIEQQAKILKTFRNENVE